MYRCVTKKLLKGTYLRCWLQYSYSKKVGKINCPLKKKYNSEKVEIQIFSWWGKAYAIIIPTLEFSVAAKVNKIYMYLKHIMTNLKVQAVCI